MTSTNKATENPVTAKYLSSLDKAQLLELLQKKTKLLLAAKVAKIPDQRNILILTDQLEIIQAAITAANNVKVG